MKYITVTLKILAHKYYQSHYMNNHFDDYDESEIYDLETFITSDEFNNIIKYYICDPKLNNDFNITNISTNYTATDYYVNIDITYTGQWDDNEIKKEIEDSTWHWFNRSYLKYGNQVHYTTSCNYTTIDDHEHDINCDINIISSPSNISKSGYYDINIKPELITIN